MDNKREKITINLLYQQSLGHMNRQVINHLWMEWLHTQFSNDPILK